jgi:hypothetical protein
MAYLLGSPTVLLFIGCVLAPVVVTTFFASVLFRRGHAAIASFSFTAYLILCALFGLNDWFNYQFGFGQRPDPFVVWSVLAICGCAAIACALQIAMLLAARRKPPSARGFEVVRRENAAETQAEAEAQKKAQGVDQEN